VFCGRPFRSALPVPLRLLLRRGRSAQAVAVLRGVTAHEDKVPLDVPKPADKKRCAGGPISATARISGPSSIRFLHSDVTVPEFSDYRRREVADSWKVLAAQRRLGQGSAYSYWSPASPTAWPRPTSPRTWSPSFVSA
ncbi:unnamed protein product, partial [Staurois parvus]